MCEHECRDVEHAPVSMGRAIYPSCNACMGCKKRISHGELNEHLRTCHTKQEKVVMLSAIRRI